MAVGDRFDGGFEDVIRGDVWWQVIVEVVKAPVKDGFTWRRVVIHQGMLEENLSREENALLCSDKEIAVSAFSLKPDHLQSLVINENLKSTQGYCASHARIVHR